MNPTNLLPKICSSPTHNQSLILCQARLIEDNKGMSATEASSQVLEAGEWKLSGSKLKPAFQSKIRSGKKHLGWLVMQLNAIFVSGTVFLRRNPTAKIWALVYLVCLHLWVLYILLSHSSTSSIELKSGAVISLENFSNSSLQQLFSLAKTLSQE